MGNEGGAGSGSEALLRDLIETCPDAVVFIDAANRIVLFNQAATKVFRYSARDALGQPVELLMPAPHAEAHRGYVKEYEKTGVPRAIGQVRQVHVTITHKASFAARWCAPGAIIDNSDRI